jgi:toxin secretion/phage lysis holin
MMDWVGRVAASATAKAIMAVLVAAVSTLFGEWAPPMRALLFLMVADFVSAWLRAGKQKQLSSETAWKGLVRKFAMVAVMIVVGQQVDVFLNTTFWRDGIVLLYCATEVLSILENAVALGLPVPVGLKDILVQLKERKFVAPGGEDHTAPPGPPAMAT